MLKEVVLKKGKEKIVYQRHHWIFSGAIEKLPSIEPGEILVVKSYDGKCLGHGYFNPKNNLTGRMLSFEDQSYKEAISQSLTEAIHLRKKIFDSKTTAYRLINGEGDKIPGLIVDRYDHTLVIQIGTQGIERLKPWLIQELARLFPCQCIFEKSLSVSRKEEGMQPFEQILFGNMVDEIEVLEGNLRFLVNPREGQKSGFFLDQREMRQLVKELSFSKKILNCFCYTGGFSVYALAGGCEKVDSVDISTKALQLAQQNLELNGFSSHNNALICEDVFQFLRNQPLDYDLVILDPPAFAKKKHEVIQACRGYKEINRLAMQKMPAKSFLLTCSCSYHVDEKLFQQVLFQAGLEAKRAIKIISKHRLGADHPINLYHPEIDYLKSYLLYLE